MPPIAFLGPGVAKHLFSHLIRIGELPHLISQVKGPFENNSTLQTS